MREAGSSLGASFEQANERDGILTGDAALCKSSDDQDESGTDETGIKEELLF
ncbi:hypothetical protein [Caproicibacter fermentans]|uniref:hypothetical protein n=1 Tax=Caproicibacter fermentans TaxID=2576756 RepID=UPI0012ED5092|nr:hypothetical protein [Caproicibacter fermentans]